MFSIPRRRSRSPRSSSNRRMFMLALTIPLLLILIPAVYFGLKTAFPAKAAWMDTAWTYRMTVNIVNNGSTQSSYQVMVPVDTYALMSTGKMNSDCSDMRFADSAGSTMGYWIEYCASDATKGKSVVWVTVPTITGGTTTSIYLYYGNTGASAVSAYTSLPTGINIGSGADGNIAVSANTNINTADTISGRACSDTTGGDAVIYTTAVNAASGDSAINAATTVASSCLSAGDEVIIIVLSGANSGKFEFARAASNPSGNTISLNHTLTNSYNGASESVVIQRVPNYGSVTMSGTAAFTPSSWNGTSGGIMAFRANGNVTIIAGTSIHANFAGSNGGNRGTGGIRGVAAAAGGGAGGTGTNGTTGSGNGAGLFANAGTGGGGGTNGINGTAANNQTAPGGGGGGGAGGGGGGSFGTTGTNGTNGSNGGVGGNGSTNGGGSGAGGVRGVLGEKGNTGATYGNGNFVASNANLFLGSGGGGGGAGGGGGGADRFTGSGANGNGGVGGNGGLGGNGGGIVAIFANSITNNGLITAAGQNGTGGNAGNGGNAGTGNTSGGGGGAGGGGGGGGGSGGSIWLSGNAITVGNSSGNGTVANGGAAGVGGAAGGGGGCGTGANDGGGAGGGGASGGARGNTACKAGTGVSNAGNTAATSGNGGVGGQGRVFEQYNTNSGVTSPAATGVQLPVAASPSIEETNTGAATVIIANWKFDEGYGTSAFDSIANATTATLSGATLPTWRQESDCVAGKCLYFGGTSSTLTVANPLSLKSISFWVRPNTSASTAFVDLDGGTTTIATNGSSVLTTTGFSSPTLYLDGRACTTCTIVANRWQHITVTSATAANSNSSMRLGSSGATFLKGFIDDVRIYSTTLSSSDAKSDFVARGSDRGTAVQNGSPSMAFLNDGLVGYWPMDESSWTVDCSSGSVLDLSGNSNHGRACPNTTGPSGAAAAKFGVAGSFDGTNDYLEVPTASNLHPGDVFTLAAWVKRSSTGTFDAIFGSGTDDFQLAFVNDNIKVSKQSTSDVFVSTSTYTDTTSWHHIAAVKNGALSTKVYWDGVEIAGTYTDQTIVAGSSSIYIGGDSFAGDIFAGSIDEARIYNRALSTAEISALYSWSPGPVAYWRMDENSGQNVYDSSGNGLTGVLGDDTTTEGDDAIWDIGKFGASTAYTANPADRHITVADSPLLSVTAAESLTVSAWVRRTGDAEFNNAMAVISKSNGDSAAGYYLNLSAPDCGNASSGGDFICFAIHDGTDQYQVVTTTTLTADSTWHHVAAVFDRSSASNINIYIDGVVQPVTRTGTLGNIGTADDPEELCIGVSQAATCAAQLNQMNGNIDELKIYKYARSQREILEDMNGGHPMGGSPIGSQTLYWPLDEQQGSTVNNKGYGGTSYAGTISGVAWSATSISSCKVNGCVNLDTATDYISVADTNLGFIDSLAGFSTSFWINPQSMATDRSILSKNDASQRSFAIVTDASDNTKLRVHVAASAGEAANTTYCTTDSGALTTSVWQHFIINYDGTQSTAANRVKVYKNGRQINCSMTGTFPATMTSGSTSDLRLGDDVSATYTALLAYIDELKIYNATLTDAQIKVEANYGSSSAYGTGSDEATQITGSAETPPVGYWRFDDNTSTTAVDSSGNSLTGTLTNGPTWDVGRVGSSVHFDGSDDLVTVANNALLEPSTNMSLSGWIYLDQLASTKGESEVIAIKRHSVSPFYSYQFYIDTSSDYVCFQWKNNSSTNFSRCSATALTTGRWYHVAAVKSASDIRIYIDGVDSPGTATGGSPTGTLYDSDSVFNIGAGLSSDSRTDGMIDDVKLYNYARTAAQVAYDFSRGAPIGWWKLDDCTGTTINDLSILADLGTANDGTWTGAGGGNTSAGSCATVDTATAWYNGRNGKYNSSLDFDGTDDQVTLTDLSYTESASQLSWTVWVNPGTLTTEDFIFAKGNQFGSQLGWMLSTNSLDSSALFMSLSTSFADFAESPTGVLANGSWTHIALVFDGTQSGNANRLKLYINGKPVTLTFTGTIPASTNATTSNGVLGSSSDDGSGSFFNGQIDDFRIYSYPITQTQLQKIINESSSVRFGPSTGSP